MGEPKHWKRPGERETWLARRAPARGTKIEAAQARNGGRKSVTGETLHADETTGRKTKTNERELLLRADQARGNKNLWNPEAEDRAKTSRGKKIYAEKEPPGGKRTGKNLHGKRTSRRKMNWEEGELKN
jgi:hypothetical protein